MRVRFDRVSFSYPKDGRDTEDRAQDASAFELKEINFSVESGDVLLVLGHNGSGKSTFLRLLNGILKPTSGEVILGEVSTTDKRTSELARFCSLSFQNPDDQLFAPTVEKEIRFGIGNIGGDGGLFDHVVRILCLEEHLRASPYSLSYATRRVVAIASNAAMDTPIVALDEPTAGLSAKEKTQFLDLIRFLSARGKTIIIVTHDTENILALADSLVMLSHGELRFSGKRDEFFGKAEAPRLLRDCGLKFPVYPRISRALELPGVGFSSEDISDRLSKRKAGTTLRTNGRHRLEGA